MRSILAAWLLVLAPLAWAGEAPSLTEIEQLIDRGEHEPALKLIETLREQLPLEAKLAKWRVSLTPTNGYPCERVLIGERHVYIICPHSPRSPHPVGLADDRPLINDTRHVYDFNTMLTCVDGVTGERLWTRYLAGRYKLALSPREDDDDLYCWRESVYRLGAADGEVLSSAKLPPSPGADFPAIAVDGHVLTDESWRGPVNDGDNDLIRAYDLRTGKETERSVTRSARLAPNESQILEVSLTRSAGKVATTFSTHTLDGKPRWSFEVPGETLNDPLWYDDDLIALTDHEAIRLDGADGRVRWRFRPPRGVARPSVGLRNNGYTRRDSSVGTAGGLLFVLGEEGTLHFLDPESGEPSLRFTPITAHLAVPKVVGDALIVGDQDELRAIPLDTVFDRRPVSERALLLLTARCHRAAGDLKAAVKSLDLLLNHLPECAEGWLLRAELCREMDRPLEEIAARCRHMALTGAESSEELARRWGLVKRIDTDSDILAEMHAADGPTLHPLGTGNADVVFAGTAKGELYAIDSQSLDIVERKRFPSSIRMLTHADHLGGFLGDRGRFEVAPPSGRFEGAPDEWNAVSGYDGRAVSWKGKYYRPRKGGIVHVLDGDEVEKFETPLKGIESWRIQLTPDGPMGQSTRAVYRLDENLCPTDILINADSPPIGAIWGGIIHMAATSRTIGLVVFNRDNGAVMQIWSRDGKRLLRQQKLGRAVKETHSEGHFRPLGGGYLYVGSHLAWLSPDEDIPAWKFGVGDEPGRAVPDIAFAHTSFYGKPVVCEPHLFTTCRDGGIYVFDLTRILK